MTPAYTALTQTLLLLTQPLCVSTGFICPDLSYLDSFVQLVCTGGSGVHRYRHPSDGDVARCVLTEGTPCQPESASASVINSTQSVFNISGIQTTDAGTWSCENAFPKFETCNLTVAKTPTCSITSKEDTDVLAQYQALKLTVDIQDYYCSTALNFSLQTGNVTTLLMEADSVASVTHNTSSETLNVTDSHLGIVGLMFSCHNSRLNITCDGVTELIPKTPTCHITSDKDTETLTLYEEVTLTVDIAAYYNIRGSYCSVDSEFTLQTGDVTQLLNVAGTGADHDLSPITFNVTKTHLGGVRLIFYCQHKHWNLTCDGVEELNNKIKTRDVLATASIPVIAASVVGAIVFLIIVVVIIVFLVKRKQVTQIKPQPSLKPSSPPYITVGAPGSSAYATVELQVENDAPSGSKNITVIDVGGYACTGDLVNNAETRSSSLTKDGSHELSMAKTSTDNPKNDLGVVVQHIVPEEKTSQINELYASINKTKDMTVHNDDTAI